MKSELKRLFDSDHVPYETIKLAVSGDEAAPESVLEHYAPWINRYATLSVSSNAEARGYIDPVLRQEIEDDFILRILKFKDLTE